MNEIKLGEIVYSKAGRDKEGYYIVVEKVDDNFVKIADGKYRTIAKPKLKKVKHLKVLGIVFSGIATKLSEGKQVFDAEIVSSLRQWKESNQD